MKLYIMDSGVCNLRPPHYLGVRKGGGEPFTIPVPVMLIKHPSRGPVLVDTGFNNEHLPEAMRADPPTVMRPDQHIVQNLAKLGYTSADIEHVIVTHLHVDHTGWMELFENAHFIVRRNEYEYALKIANSDAGEFVEGYLVRDYANIPVARFTLVDDEVDCDVFGDGSVILIDSKGHTAGHQSVVVALPNTGRMLLAADAIQLQEDLDTDEFMKGGCWNTDRFKQTQIKIQALVKQGCKIVYGHDPDCWSHLRLSPECYD